MTRISFNELPQGMFETLMSMENFINQSNIDFKLLELIRLRVSQINGCAYCVDMHHKELKHLGETDLRASSLSIWQETPYFTDKERTVLEFTEKLTHIEQNSITDELFTKLSSYFDKSQISFLTLAISQINVWTRLMKTFKFEPGNYQVHKK